MFIIFLLIFLLFLALWLFFSFAVIYHLRRYSFPGWTAARLVVPLFFLLSFFFFFVAAYFLFTIPYAALTS